MDVPAPVSFALTPTFNFACENELALAVLLTVSYLLLLTAIFIFVSLWYFQRGIEP